MMLPVPVQAYQISESICQVEPYQSLQYPVEIMANAPEAPVYANNMQMVPSHPSSHFEQLQQQADSFEQFGEKYENIEKLNEKVNIIRFQD